MGNAIRFRASLPPIQSAIKIGGDSMRVQLDVPGSDMQEAVALAALQGVVLCVTVEVASQVGTDGAGEKHRKIHI